LVLSLTALVSQRRRRTRSRADARNGQPRSRAPRS
jgi:hypothetical protein